MVKPSVDDCPDSYEVSLKPQERTRAVVWREPSFTDNVGIDRILKTKEPGTILSVGKHLITYTAVDKSGNRAQCSFTVHLKLHPLTFRRPSSNTHPNRTPVDNNFQRQGFLCPYLLIRRTEIITKYMFHRPCQSQRFHPTIQAPGYRTFVPRDHRVRHHHDRGRNSLHGPFFNSSRSGRRRGLMRDDPGVLSQVNVTVLPSSAPNLKPPSHAFNVEQRTQQDELLKWQQKLQTTTPVVVTQSDEVRVESGARTPEEEQRLKRYEVELIKWRENMKKYHQDMERLRENSRRFSPG